MMDDLIARLELAAASYERNAECGATTSSVQNEQFTAALFREAITALTAQGETVPATDHTAARTKLREWIQQDAAAASSLPAAEGMARHVAVDPFVRSALSDIMAVVQEGARGTCGATCGDLRECSRCQWLDSASDRIEQTIRAALLKVTAMRAVAEGRR